MSDANRASAEQWPLQRALLLGAVCLAIGLTSGWLIRGWDAGTASSSPAPSVPAQQQAAAANPVAQTANADAQAAPLLEQLKTDPANADILIKLGNLYYDTQQYPAAVDYYGRALAIRPADANVRTDRGTAYWYMGNADSAIAEFNTALTYQADNPNTLFNRGLVRWKGKHDGAGALADWKRLLEISPNYDAKYKVQQMMAEVASQSK